MDELAGYLSRLTATVQVPRKTAALRSTEHSSYAPNYKQSREPGILVEVFGFVFSLVLIVSYVYWWAILPG